MKKNKYFYPIFKLKIKSWIKYWLIKKTEFKGKLSEILEGFSFTLNNTLSMKFNLFEIYGNSIQDGEPSPDNEVPILSSGDNGSITEKIINKNWFDKNNATYTNNLSYSNDFTQFLSDVAQLRVYYISCKPNTTYSVSKKIGSYLRCGSCASIPANGVAISTTVSSSNNKATITTKANDKYIYFSPIRSSELETLTYEDVIQTLQIELGSTATPYVPHEEQTYTIPVLRPMLSLGDVRDCFVKENGTWYERHFIGRKILNGTEAWYGSYNPVNDTLRFYINFTTGQQNAGLCNNFSLGDYNNRATDGVEHFYVSTATIHIRIKQTIANTVEELKNWLAEKYASGNPVYVDYELATPLDLPCTEEQTQQLENPPKTYAGQTTVFSIDKVKPYLRVQYYKE